MQCRGGVTPVKKKKKSTAARKGKKSTTAGKAKKTSLDA
jgi:hypothetical protein